MVHSSIPLLYIWTDRDSAGRPGNCGKVLQIDYAIVREGEIVLTDLWFILQAQRFAGQTGKSPGPVVRTTAKALYPLPPRIDFRVCS
jgi:hypothetical protein